MNTIYQYRHIAVFIGGLLAAYACLAIRLFDLQIIRHHEFQNLAHQLTIFDHEIEAPRGEIRDRHETPLAVSCPVETIYLNLALCSNHIAQVVPVCSRLLGMPATDLEIFLKESCQPRSNGVALPQAAVCMKDVSPADWNKIRSALKVEDFGLNQPRLKADEMELRTKLRTSLLFAREGQARRYPYGGCLSHVFGVRRISGIENECNSILAGTAGRCVSDMNAAGQEQAWLQRENTPPILGNNVVLTIDLPLQLSVENIVETARQNCGAKTASVIVMDPYTGEIYVLASAPNFDPMDPEASPRESWRNPVFCDMEEPGSTFKIFLLAAWLEGHKASMDDSVFCENGCWVNNHTAIHDHAPSGYLTLRRGLEISSNILFAKLAGALGPRAYYAAMLNFGFGAYTHTPLIKEGPGRIDHPEKWQEIGLTTRAGFGQGFLVTQLQMASAVCAIANGGWLPEPRLVLRTETPGGKEIQHWSPVMKRRVMRPEIAATVKEGMVGVEIAGTGTRAAVPGYSAGVKTGTAQKSGKSGYLAGKYYSSMVGIFPADHPRVVIVVALDEPQIGYYAADVAAPVFRAIAEATARRLNIQPDQSPAQPEKIPEQHQGTPTGHLIKLHTPVKTAPKPQGGITLAKSSTP